MVALKSVGLGEGYRSDVAGVREGRLSSCNAEKVKTLVLFSLAVWAMSGIPVAQSKSFDWTACMLVCEVVAAAATVATCGAAAPLALACVPACAPLLPLPCPF